MATRVAGRKVMNAVAPRLPTLIGGSADLNPSTHTALSGLGDFEPTGVTVSDKQGAVEAPGAVAWRVALEARDHPIALVLTRQNVPTLDRAQCAATDGLRQGAYVLADAANGRPDVILIATGSEVGLIMAARQTLQERNVMTRVVSMPSWERSMRSHGVIVTRYFCLRSMRGLPQKRARRRAGIATSAIAVMCWAWTAMAHRLRATS